MRAKRHVRRPPDLTSLFDVLFIVVFASLIRAAAVQNAAAQAAQPPPVAKPKPPALPADVATLRTRALVDLDKQLAQRTPLVIRVSVAGTVTALEVDGKTVALDAPLLEHIPDPDVAVAYLGERSAELRICRIAAVHLNVVDLSRYLVIVAPARALADLSHALYDGLHRDLDRCLAEQHGLATIIEP